MTQKAKKITNIVATAIPSALVLLSGFMKLTGAKQIIDKLALVGMADYIYALGAMEIVFTILFIIPKTMKIGFILLSCYFAGAIATDLSHNESVANAMLPIILVWISVFIRDRGVFVEKKFSVS
jgi:hypothetical protein